MSEETPISITADAGEDGLGWSVRHKGLVIARFRDEAMARACLDQFESSPGIAARTAPPGEGWEEIVTRGFTRHNGPMWVNRAGGEMRFGVITLPKHRNRKGIIHGGMLMTFADRVLGMFIAETTGDIPHATIHMDTHFVSAAQVGDFLEARCEIVRRTRSVVFVSAVISIGDRIVTRTQGIWKLQ